MKKLFTPFLFLLFISAKAQEYYMLVGTYDSPQSEGIYVYRFNTKNGIATKVNQIKTSNPSFIAVSPNEKFVYTVHEIAPQDGKGGDIAAFAFNKLDGSLTLLNRQLSGGDHPCHVEVDKTGRWLFASNYTSGTLSVLPINLDGSLGKASTIQHEGSGPFPKRQTGPHVHGAYISKDNKQLLVTDLGTDKIMLYDFDDKTGKLTPSSQPFVQTQPGSGPRVLRFHPTRDMVYVIEELGGSFSIYDYVDHQLIFKRRVSTLEKGDTSLAGSADINISKDGNSLYTSNRADHNMINVYDIRYSDGPHFIHRQSTLGKTPRNFVIDPSSRFLLCENQNSDEIVIFKRNKNTGLLTDSKKRISVGKPVCIKWINIK